MFANLCIKVVHTYFGTIWGKLVICELTMLKYILGGYLSNLSGINIRSP